MADDAWKPVTQKRKKISIVKQPEVFSGEKHILDDTWVMWFHDLNSDDWSINSYSQLLRFNTAEDYWIMYNNLSNTYNGMYYLMRQGIPPIWDDPINIHGGGWTFKVDKKFAQDMWQKLSNFCVCETLSQRYRDIVGVSISPKIKFVTIRVWTNSNVKKLGDFENIKKDTINDSMIVDFSNARFTPNMEAHK